MQHERTRWGLFFFLVSPLIITVLLLLIHFYPPAKGSRIYGTLLPCAGALISLICVFSGWLSYPRVHNLRVYLLGSLIGLVGLTFILYSIFFDNPASHIRVVYIAVFFNFLVVSVLPSYAKYRNTRRVTLSIVLMEVCVFGFFTAFPSLTRWTSVLVFRDFYHLGAWGSVLWAGFVLLTSSILMKQEFYLGGVITGCSLFYLTAWLIPLWASFSRSTEMALFVMASIYFIGGILIHWFSRMEHRVFYDPLLQVYNRQFLSRIIEEQVSINTAPPFGVAMIDIDHFKNINDRYGHQVGDELLYQIAQTVQREVVPEGVVCRYGGEEIAVFFPQKQIKKIVPIMERVRSAIERLRVSSGKTSLSVTISCGVSHRCSASQSISEVIAQADKALFSAKKNGRNQVKAGRSVLR